MSRADVAHVVPRRVGGEGIGHAVVGRVNGVEEPVLRYVPETSGWPIASGAMVQREPRRLQTTKQTLQGACFRGF
jgi:hypothetical protein